MQHLPSACMLSHRFCISSDVEFLKVSEESSTEGGHLLWWRTDWLKTQHCRDSITIGKSWHSGQHCKADMGKENYDKKIMQDDSNFSHFWLSQRLWSSLDRTYLKNTADMHLWKKKSSAYHLPAALELSENLYDLSSEKRHWDISTF